MPPRAICRQTSMGELLESIMSSPEPFIMMACCSKTFFLDQLMYHIQRSASILEQSHGNSVPSPAEHFYTSEHTEGQFDIKNASQNASPLLSRTLASLITGEKSKMIFCPTLQSFRACLATLPDRVNELDPMPPIYIIDMVYSHYGTTDFTLQGLSRSFASLASVANHCQVNVNLIECFNVHDVDNPRRGHQIWDVEVPLLSESIKIGQAGQGWASRKICIRKFASKWIQFVQT